MRAAGAAGARRTDAGAGAGCPKAAAREPLRKPRVVRGMGYADAGRDVEILRRALPWAAAAMSWEAVARETGVPARALSGFASGGVQGIRQDWFDRLWAWLFHGA